MATQADVRRIALSVRVATLDDKEVLLALDQKKFFTEPPRSSPAVTARELRPLITEAWRCQAPKAKKG